MLYFGRLLEKFDNRFGLSQRLEKHWAPRRRYTRAGSIESVSLRCCRWSAGPPLAWGPIRRNWSNRLKTGPGHATWLLVDTKSKIPLLNRQNRIETTVSTHTRKRQHKRLQIASVSSNIFEAVVANKP